MHDSERRTSTITAAVRVEIRLGGIKRDLIQAIMLRLTNALRGGLSRAPFSSSAALRMKVVPVPVREDNYAYLLIDEKANKALAVDPYDVPAVQSAAAQAGVELAGSLTTHHHFDHSGGNEVRDPSAHPGYLHHTILMPCSHRPSYVSSLLIDPVAVGFFVA